MRSTLILTSILIATFSTPALAQAPSAPAAAPSVTPIPPTPAVKPAADAMEPARLEAMLAAGDDGMIVQTFTRHPTRVLPFIDRYLEGGLAMIEKGEDSAKAMASYRTGIKFAKLSSEALHDNAIEAYANAFASWSPTEQKTFREGQKAYKKGAEAAGSATGDLGAALSSFRHSLALAQSLGDAWGEAMAQSAIAETALKLNRLDEAHTAAIRAIEVNNRLKLQEDFLRSMLTCAVIREKMGMPDSGVGHLRQAWTFGENDATIDEKFKDEILAAFLAGLERTGKKDEAETILKERAEKTGG